MEREDILKFTNSVILLSKLLYKIEDRFFAQKFHGKISDFISAFIEKKTAPSSNVAQYHKNLLNSINNVIDSLEYLAHVSKNETTPLFVAQRNLLKLKLHFLKKRDIISPAMANLETPKPAKRKPVRLILKSNSNKERIFNFIKDAPEVRTKDVMDEFRVLSGRTVKRNLKELTDGGFLKKKSDGVAVYYLPADLN